jgi:tripartite-type tricarboxylate transporter receptor subunit TctC
LASFSKAAAMRNSAKLLAGWLMGAALLTPNLASAQSDFYKGKQIVMLVGTAAGGGYDTYARTLARHMPKFIPGAPVIVVKNMPGADGLVAVSSLYNSAPRDGTEIAALTNGIAMDPLFGRFEGRFDALKLNWLGSIGKLMNICVTWNTSPVKTLEQAQRRETIVSASGATSNSAMMPKIANALLGTKFKIVGGYSDADVALAMERGEVEGLCGLAYTTLKATHADWFRDHKVNVLLQIGLTRAADLPETPSALELASDANTKKVLQLLLVRQEMGRPFAAPPGVPADRMALLRHAFEATLKDKDFLADAQRLQMEVDSLTSEAIMALLKSAYAAPPSIVAQAAKLVP